MKNKPIVLFKPKFRVNEVLNKLKPILKLGWTGIGYKTTEFEKEWSKYTGLKNSLFLNSATAGLDLAVQVFKANNNWSESCEIICPLISFVSCGLRYMAMQVRRDVVSGNLNQAKVKKNGAAWTP